MASSRREILRTAATAPIVGLAALAGAAEAARPALVRSGQSRGGAALTIAGRPFAATKIAGIDVAGRYAAFVIDTPAGRGPELHVHDDQNEWFFLIGGSIGLQCGRDRMVLRAGDSFLAPANVPHAYVTLGPSVATIINLFDPAGGMEGFFVAYARMFDRPDRVTDRARLQHLYRQYGMHMTGEPLQPEFFEEPA